MVVGFGRASLWVGKIPWSRLSFLWVGVIVSDFGMTIGVVLRLSRIYFLSCLFVLPIRMLQSNLFCLDPLRPFLVSGISPLLGILMIGSSLWLCPFLSSFIPFFREERGWILSFGNFVLLVSLMLVPFIVLYKVHSSEKREVGYYGFWKLRTSGQFDVRSFYCAFQGPKRKKFPWLGIWGVKAPRPISFFIWTAARGKILTYDNLMRMGHVLAGWLRVIGRQGTIFYCIVR